MEDKKGFIKLETHLHTGGTSTCAKVEPALIPVLYKHAGFGAIIVTNHFMRKVINQWGDIPWKQRIDNYLSGYRVLKEEGQKLGLKVFLGVELGLNEYDVIEGKDPIVELLVYGLDEKFLYDTPGLLDMKHADFFKLADKNGWLVYQSHPGRKKCIQADPKLIHGAEVFNANPRNDNYNEDALGFAEKNNLLQLSGADFHRAGTEGLGGVYIPDTIDSIQEFVEYAKHNKLELIKGELYRIY
jgi:hypothetical protein